MTVTTDNNTANGKIEFIENHLPSLTSGDYTLTVSQEIEFTSPKNIDKKIPTKSFATTLNFSILGPRFTLDPQEIQSVFPPPGSLGDHSNVLPHIIFNRSTLPWERKLVKDEDDNPLPWLALLLFTEEELSSTKGESFNLSELKGSLTNEIKWPGISPEVGQQDSDCISVIDVPWSILKDIIPTGTDLKYLSHVRKTKDKDAEDKPGEDELAIIIGNRLPTSGGMNTVHLVSLEGRYKNGNGNIVFDAQNTSDNDLIRLVSLKSWRFACIDSQQSFKGLLMHLNHQLLFNIKNIQINNSGSNKISDILNQPTIPNILIAAFQQSKHPLSEGASLEYGKWKITDQNRIYLISNNKNVYNQAGKFLFKLSPSEQIKEGTLDDQNLKLDFSKNKHKLSDKGDIKPLKPDLNCWWWIDTQYFIRLQNEILYVYHLDPDSSSTLRLPALKNNDSLNLVAEQYMKLGSVPLPHAMRQGNKTVSWYRGPLVPGINKTNNINFPVRCADELVNYNAEYGMFDVSYAAAWELGRLLALQSRSFSVSLYNWKRTHTQKFKTDAQQQLDHLPFADLSASLEFPSTVSDWFKKLTLLEGVPFNYLVSDERLLPSESIRFFQLDKIWIECLCDGAFSIGGVLPSNPKMDKNLSISPKSFVSKNISGCLIRSDVVAGWPNLLVDGYDDKNETPLELLRRAMLSKNILICLFDGVIEKLDIHLKPEALHFGFDVWEEDRQFYKKLRNPNGEEGNAPALNENEIARKKEAKMVIDITQLAENIGNQLFSKNSINLSSAQFALQMIEGVERVRFEKIKMGKGIEQQ
jgi:hypothetical protein